MNILKVLRRNFYKNIILVLGNHDYYIDKEEYETSEERVNVFKERCEKTDGIYLLDGDVVEIDGVKFGGAMGWYDGKYHKHNMGSVKKEGRPIYDRKIDTQTLWEVCLNDSLYISPSMPYDGFLADETAKIERVLAQKPDIMITHINPSVEAEHQHPSHANNVTTTFFCYDGRKHMDAFNGKYWVFGHSHFYGEFDIDGRFTLMTNCLGYYREQANPKLKTITVEKQ